MAKTNMTFALSSAQKHTQKAAPHEKTQQMLSSFSRVPLVRKCFAHASIAPDHRTRVPAVKKLNFQSSGRYGMRYPGYIQRL
ncbi:unnamed protein product [Ixodes pacificus]